MKKLDPCGQIGSAKNIHLTVCLADERSRPRDYKPSSRGAYSALPSKYQPKMNGVDQSYGKNDDYQSRDKTRTNEDFYRSSKPPGHEKQRHHPVENTAYQSKFLGQAIIGLLPTIILCCISDFFMNLPP